MMGEEYNRVAEETRKMDIQESHENFQIKNEEAFNNRQEFVVE
jgi:hypothetical protein